MAYAPRKRNTKQIKWIIAICVIVVFGAIFGFNQIKKEKSKQEFTICGFQHEKSVKTLEKKYERTYTLSDYLFYGESLNIYQNTYNVEQSDPTAGKSIILRDLCSEKEYSFVLRDKIDSQIILNTIDEGYYEIFVVDDLREKRAIFTTSVDDSIVGVARNDKHLQYRFIADSSYYSSKGVSQENYAFLSVKKIKVEEDQYDVAIDPGALDYDFNEYVLNKGSEGNSLVEYQETYKAALLLKKELEAKGLKVILLREENKERNSYGEEGRLASAYAANAKYYIRLSFSQSQLEYEGMDITYSGHANGNLSKQIIYYLDRNTEVSISGVYNPNEPGLIRDDLLKGILDKREVYDSDLWIREAGGKATQAGMYSKNAQANTGPFAKDNTHGMLAININLGYLTSSKDVTYWNTQKETYMKAIAQAMIMYLNIESK